MKLTWIISIFILTFGLIATIKSHQLRHLNLFTRQAPSITLKNFQEARSRVPKHDLQKLYLWESMLTGRSRSLSTKTKEEFTTLGLSHLFTPSGFHLSAAISPIFKILKGHKTKSVLLICIVVLIFMLQGQSALKRMSLVKLAQHWSDQKTGFLTAMGLDVLVGSFTTSPLGFSYSLLFLGIIYSRSSKLKTIVLFFLGQCLIAYFNQNQISVLLIAFNPILNIFFAVSMPFLLILAIPLWNWQLWSGLKIIGTLQSFVSFANSMTLHFPLTELCLIGILFVIFKKKYYVIFLLLYCTSLNLQKIKIPANSQYAFVPQGRIIKVISKTDYDWIYWSDGKCKRQLVGGVWFEKCSPKRRSTRKKLMKLSYL